MRGQRTKTNARTRKGPKEATSCIEEKSNQEIINKCGNVMVTISTFPFYCCGGK